VCSTNPAPFFGCALVGVLSQPAPPWSKNPVPFRHSNSWCSFFSVFSLLHLPAFRVAEVLGPLSHHLAFGVTLVDAVSFLPACPRGATLCHPPAFFLFRLVSSNRIADAGRFSPFLSLNFFFYGCPHDTPFPPPHHLPSFMRRRPLPIAHNGSPL